MGDKKENNWFGSWLTAAKNKSCEVYEFVKKDLEEFGTAVKSEASSVVNNTGNALERTLKLDEPESTASTMKRSISSFIGQMNEVLNPSPDDSDTEAILIIEGQETMKLTRLQLAIFEIQKVDKTFTEDPDESLKTQYECWLEIIEDQLLDERLSKHLLGSSVLNEKYTTLVPLTVEHGLFWKRYLFKKALLEDEIARDEAMEKREAKEKLVDENNVQWNDEDFPKNIELSEEEQIKLLEQYENETKKKQSLTKETIEEDVIFEKDATKKNKKKGGKKKVLEISSKESLNKLSPANSSSSSSTDGDWEKISETDK